MFIHGAFIADAFGPLLHEPDLARSYQLITYHSRGYGGSSPSCRPVSVERQAIDCAALLRYLGIDRAHVVGHSFGGGVALQMALDISQMVHSLTLLEPALSLARVRSRIASRWRGGRKCTARREPRMLWRISFVGATDLPFDF